MTDHFGVEVNEGESLDDAIMRLAADLQGAKEPTTEPKPKAKKESKVTVTDPGAGVEPEADVHSAIHIYTRVGEEYSQVRSYATRERAMHGPNTLVFAHDHHFGDSCTPTCRERVAK